MNKILTRTAEIKLIGNGIIKISIIEGTIIEEYDVKENHHACEKLSQGKKLAYLVSANNFTTSSEAKVFASGFNESCSRTAEAFVSNSFIDKLIGSFYVNFINLPIPTKVFNKEINAIRWLRTIQRKLDAC